MAASLQNLFTDIPQALQDEQFATLVETPGFTMSRIVSTGQATPAGEWYDQARAEWVVVLRGSARLRFEDETRDRTLGVGDFVEIAPHHRHRVTWTDPSGPTIWLALYFDAEGKG